MTDHTHSTKKTSNNTKAKRNKQAGKGAGQGDSQDNTKALQSHKISDKARQFVLKSIAEYTPYKQIVEQLKQRFGFERSADSLKNHYGHNPQYKAQIQKYRDRYNAGIADEPLSSRRHLLGILYDTLNDAREAGDYKGAASITKQIREMLGYHVSPEIEVNHHHSGGLSVEQKLMALISNPQTPPALPGQSTPLLSNPQTLDIEATKTDPS